MLRHGEVNPLAVFGLRRVDHCPPHFIQVMFDSKVSAKDLSDWVYSNTEGRFYIGDRYATNDDNTIFMSKCVSFEIPGEATYFALQLDQINKSIDF